MSCHVIRAGALAVLTCVLVLFCCAGASAATYYVDPAGSNGNDGLSPQTPWRTLLKVGISTFQPGDSILFKRDGIWNEWLTPPSSGSSGNLIRFDAYGSGRPPEFTGRYVTSSAQWSNSSGNTWQTTLSTAQPISQLRFVQFGTIWGKVQASQAALAHSRDWYYDSATQNLYVYSSGNPVTAYGSVSPIILSGQSLININGVSNIQIQHIQLDWYDAYGVQVQGPSDHIWLANISADSQVPNATTPIGFYVHPTGTPGDIHIYHTDAHRNYVGYRFDPTPPGMPAAIELKNCRAYANRTYGLMDNTAAVTYSCCHFYANNLATGVSTDVTGTPGPIDGGNNVPADTPPNIRGFLQYPARVTMTYDDPGLIDGSHQYLQALLPVFQRKAAPLSIAIVTGYSLSQQLVPTFQSWIDAGWDINAHSVSHEYFVYPNALSIQYTGTAASSVTLSIANKHLTITAPGDPSAQVSWDLTSSGIDLVPSGLDTIGGLIYTLNQRGVFAVTQDPNLKTAVKSEDLADIVSQDIKSAPYTLQIDKTRLMTDEMGWTLAWMSANLTGLPSDRVYVYPGSYEDATTETIAVGVGYAGSRGSGTMQPSPNASTVMSTGINIQNILSQGVAPNFQNLDDTHLANRVRALVFKSGVWGVPYGIFWHMNELSEHQLSVILAALKSSGATLMTNTQLVTYLRATQQNSGTTYYADSVTGKAVDVRPTAASPVVSAGMPLPPEFKYDLMGADQTQIGWTMGAYGYVPESTGRAK
jgi:hypothetical protein